MVAAILAPAAVSAGGSCESSCPPPPPPAGCTPGYWKQDQHFDSYPGAISPSLLFDAAGVGGNTFANAFPGKTVLQVLWQGGGGLNALGRHAVAALLNAYQLPGSYYGGNTVVNMFNDAYASGNYETTKNLFAAANEIGCPLN
jgi:hypothetical protein